MSLMLRTLLVFFLIGFGWDTVGISADKTVTLSGVLVDANSGSPVPGRLYVESSSGDFFLARSKEGIAIPYEKSRGESSEIHTSLSAGPFELELPPGTYQLTAERGKECVPGTQTVILSNEPVEVTLSLKRWSNMSEKGWFSGETHIHRPVSEVRTLLLCEDLNVALPLTAWVSRAEDTPLRNNRNPALPHPPRLLKVDESHVIWPVNTEYEITSVARNRHPLGALFVLNQKEPLDLSAPPVGDIVSTARSQGAIFDLDKHNWPWSMMLVPVVDVDLFELTNNHLWRTNFVFGTFFSEYTPEYMEIEMVDGGFTERGWMDFGFKNYYALLNCGFDIMPSAGTASGVHPVPVGFGRVYVKLEGPFDYDAWMKGLEAGRSFVTNGPMLEVTFDGKDPGSRIKSDKELTSVQVAGEVRSLDPLESIEIVVNGDVIATLDPGKEAAEEGTAHSFRFDEKIPIAESSWIAVRAFATQEGDRPRFAHSAPVHVEIPGKPLRAKKVEVEYLLKRVRDEIQRHEGVLSNEAVDEFRSAADFYQSLLPAAR